MIRGRRPGLCCNALSGLAAPMPPSRKLPDATHSAGGSSPKMGVSHCFHPVNWAKSSALTWGFGQKTTSRGVFGGGPAIGLREAESLRAPAQS